MPLAFQSYLMAPLSPQVFIFKREDCQKCCVRVVKRADGYKVFLRLDLPTSTRKADHSLLNSDKIRFGSCFDYSLTPIEKNTP